MAICLIAFVAAGCGGPDQKKMKFYNKGKALYEKGDYVKARLEFKNAAQIDPNFGDAFYMLGMTAFRTGNLNEAYGSLSKAVGLQPKDMKARVELARVLLQGRAFDKAVENADLVLKAEPANEQALIVKAAAFLAKKEGEKTLGLMKDLIAKGSKSADAYLLMSAASIQKNDFHGAEQALVSGIKVIPQSLPLNLSLADVLVRSKRTDDAVAVMQHVISLDPHNPAHKLILAGLYWDGGKQDKARDLLKGVVAGDQKDESGRLQVSGFYLAKNKVDEAEQELKAGIAQNGKSIKLRLALAELYMNTNRSDVAVSTLKESLGLEKDPANPDIILVKNGLAKIYLMRRDTGEATKYVDQVLKESPKNLDAHFIKGSIYLAKGEGAGAVPEFRTVVTEKPQFVLAYVRMAEAHAMNNEFNLASDTLLNALKIDPRSRDAALALARVQVMQKQYGSAEAQLRKMLEQNPNDLDVRTELGDLLVMEKEPGRAEVEYGEMKKRAPKNPAGYAKLGMLSANQGKFDKARAEFEQALKLAPDSPVLLSSLVQVYVAQKKYDAAVSLCDSRIKQNGNDAVAYNLLGQVYGAQKAFTKAEEALNKAIELQPAWMVPLANLAQLYVAQGQTGAAIKRLNDTLKSKPDNMTVCLLLGQLYHKNKEYPAAVNMYEKVLEKQPANWAVANDLAFLLAEQGKSGKQLDRARDLAQKALTARPNEPSIQDTLGWVYFKQGDMNRASDLIAKAYAKMTNSPAVNYHMGMVSYKAGKLAEAKGYLAKAVKSGEAFDGKEEAQGTLGKL